MPHSPCGQALRGVPSYSFDTFNVRVMTHERNAFVASAFRPTLLLVHGSAGIVAELAAKLNGIDAMFGGLPRTQENHRHIVVVSSAKLRVFVDIDFGEARAKFLEHRR